jgi:hypothetical protein
VVKLAKARLLAREAHLDHGIVQPRRGRPRLTAFRGAIARRIVTSVGAPSPRVSIADESANAKIAKSRQCCAHRILLHQLELGRVVRRGEDLDRHPSEVPRGRCVAVLAAPERPVADLVELAQERTNAQDCAGFRAGRAAAARGLDAVHCVVARSLDLALEFVKKVPRRHHVPGCLLRAAKVLLQ